MSIAKRIQDETNLYYQDKGYYFESILDKPEKYVNWKDISKAIDMSEILTIDLINKNTSQVINIPEKTTVWNGVVKDKEFIKKHYMQGHGIVIKDYHFSKNKLNELRQTIQNIFIDVECDTHIYSDIDDAQSFKVHADKSANFIFQVYGETHWKIYKNRLSDLLSVSKLKENEENINEEELDIDIDVVLKSGDGIYIPKGAFHCARPKGNRISISIPCKNRGENN